MKPLLVLDYFSLFSDEVDVEVLSQGAIIGIAIAALIFVALLVVVIVVVLDALPCSKNKKKPRNFPAGNFMFSVITHSLAALP